jgi:predicted phage terminase large subunit-like protein
MTRWSKLDLTGQIINHMTKNPEADQWEVVELPAVLPSGKPLWPEFWTIEELDKKKISVGPAAWAAQYLQQPTSEGAQLLKKEWWKHWDKEDPPDCEFTIMSLDAAQEAHNKADYNAVTHWGVFYLDDPTTGKKQANIILLNAWKKRMEFPDLKKAILDDYNKWEPDTFIVEKKSNGAALYQELRRMGISVAEFTPGKGQDKISRVNSISDIISSGIVWAPTDRRWAQEVIDECAEFPLGAHDDMVDSLSQALMRFRTGGFISLPSDYEDDEKPAFRHSRSRGYY